MKPVRIKSKGKPVSRSLLVVGLIVILVLLLARTPQSRIQAVTLSDGTRVQFLGLSEGTIHWNPSTPFVFRIVSRVPKVSSVFFPLLPKSARNTPTIYQVSKPSGVLWFHIDKRPLLGHLVVRCFSENGVEMGDPFNLNFRSSTNVASICLINIPVERIADIRIVDVFLRDMPLSGRPHGILNSVTEMDIIPGTRVCQFKL
jgi:hypothetical protein